MLLHRRILLGVALVGVTGSLCTTLGYGLYLRSDRYRHGVEREVTELLNLPVSIGRIRTLTTTSRAFYNISVAQPRRPDEVFRCDRAIWHEERDNGHPQFALELIDGWLLAGTHQWAEEDYRAMLQSGLGQDFVALNLRRIHLAGMHIEWQHPDITLSLRNAVGEMAFNDDGTGRAALVSHDLNGYEVERPVKIIAHFTPGAGLRFHEAELHLPGVPLGHLGLSQLLRADVTHGVFNGELAYSEEGEKEHIRFSGAVKDAALEELTEPLIGGPFHGRVNVVVEEAAFLDRRLDELRFRGNLGDLRLTELVPMLRTSPLDSRVELRVHQASICAGVVEYLSASGKATDLPLEQVTSLIGRGLITGKLRVDIRSLQIVDDTLIGAEVDLIAVPPDDAPGLIDRALLDWAAQEIIGLDVARFLPERVEYAQFGVKLIVDGDVLRVRGTHGSDGRTILTVRVLGREWPVVREFDRAFEIGPLVAQVREQIDSYNMERVRRWWEIIHSPPPEQP